MENKDKALPTAEEILQKYLDVDNTPMKGNEWILDVADEYKSLHTADLEARLKEKDHDILRLRGLLSDSDSQLKTVLEENESLKKAAEGLVEHILNEWTPRYSFKRNEMFWVNNKQTAHLWDGVNDERAKAYTSSDVITNYQNLINGK